MAKTPHDFYLETNGKYIDVDGYYGAQCWDLFAYYCKWLGYPVINCGGDGFAHQLWYRRNQSGILNYFEAVTSNFQDGDVIIWGKCAACPSSHVAIFRKDNGNGTIVALGQNQAATMNACQINITKQGILGGFRPKCYVKKATTDTNKINWINETGTATFTKDNIIIREDNPDGKNTGLVYNAGMSVNYYQKCAYKGHRWIRYKSNSGKIRCVAVSGSETRGKDPWATFK